MLASAYVASWQGTNVTHERKHCFRVRQGSPPQVGRAAENFVGGFPMEKQRIIRGADDPTDTFSGFRELHYDEMGAVETL